MAIFIDVLYPGNKERKKRIDEVTADCSSMFAEAARNKADIEQLLAECDKVIREAYQGIAVDPPSQTAVALSPAWTVYVPTLLVDTLASTAAVFALRWAWANGLVALGKITAQQLAELGLKGAIEIVIPKWLRIGTEGLAGVAAAVVVDLLIDSISGAVQREELQKGIREITETRVGMKEAEMLNILLKNTLRSVIMTFQALQGLVSTPEIYNAAVQNLLDQNKVSRDAITRAAAVAQLQEMDSLRNSWTKEDGDWATKTVSNRMLAAAPAQALSVREIASNAIASLALPQERRNLALQRLLA